jgi:hypothetical protein
MPAVALDHEVVRVDVLEKRPTRLSPAPASSATSTPTCFAWSTDNRIDLKRFTHPRLEFDFHGGGRR